MNPALQTNLPAFTFALESFKPQIPTDATVVAGNTIDRNAYANAKSALVLSQFTYTDGSSSSPTHAQLIALYSDVGSAMSTETSFKSRTWTISGGSDGAKHAFFALPVNMLNANRYIRGKFTTTKGGTDTITLMYASQLILLGGMEVVPYSGYSDAGYATSTDIVA